MEKLTSIREQLCHALNPHGHAFHSYARFGGMGTDDYYYSICTHCKKIRLLTEKEYDEARQVKWYGN